MPRSKQALSLDALKVMKQDSLANLLSDVGVCVWGRLGGLGGGGCKEVFGDLAGSQANSMAGATGWCHSGPATRLGRRHGRRLVRGYPGRRTGPTLQEGREHRDPYHWSGGMVRITALLHRRITTKQESRAGDCGQELAWATAAYRERELEGMYRR